jgi:hypothetical protein
MTGAVRLRLKVLGAGTSAENHLTSDWRDISTLGHACLNQRNTSCAWHPPKAPRRPRLATMPFAGIPPGDDVNGLKLNCSAVLELTLGIMSATR